VDGGHGPEGMQLRMPVTASVSDRPDLLVLFLRRWWALPDYVGHRRG
jgi:hypothetical protein